MKIMQADLFGGESEVRNVPRSPYIAFKINNNYRLAEDKNKRCKNCRHHCAHGFSKIYHKCKLLGCSNSEATDIRVSYTCNRWEARPTTSPVRRRKNK
jgi:hypothetical protein